jgi:hypothetical protein
VIDRLDGGSVYSGRRDVRAGERKRARGVHVVGAGLAGATAARTLAYTSCMSREVTLRSRGEGKRKGVPLDTQS